MYLPEGSFAPIYLPEGRILSGTIFPWFSRKKELVTGTGQGKFRTQALIKMPGFSPEHQEDPVPCFSKMDKACMSCLVTTSRSTSVFGIPTGGATAFSCPTNVRKMHSFPYRRHAGRSGCRGTGAETKQPAAQSIRRVTHTLYPVDIRDDLSMPLTNRQHMI